MRAPRRGNGSDFNPNAPYRMYHGDRIPGFPQHPHRGFETITATLDGIVDHTDSMGNAGRYGEGDLQWMTAGKGVVHGEMFPLINEDKGNDTRFFQIWLNLPKKSKMTEPAFVMHWGSETKKVKTKDGMTDIIIWVGEHDGERTEMKSPPNSWAADKENDVGVVFYSLKPGAKCEIKPASGGKKGTKRFLYFVEGEQAKQFVSGTSIPKKHGAEIVGDKSALLENKSETETMDVLLLQGRPIGEPVSQHGPFVMNTREEIMQCFEDYQRTRFGGWPWDKDAMVFPKDKPRFALLNGKEELGR
jgi:quercetin 2,3-dioxygenase